MPNAWYVRRVGRLQPERGVFGDSEMGGEGRVVEVGVDGDGTGEETGRPVGVVRTETE